MMVTIGPRWKVPVEDHGAQRSQLGLDPMSDGRLQFTPPIGKSFTMSLVQLTDAIKQLDAIRRLLETATHEADVARDVGRVRTAREGCPSS